MGAGVAALASCPLYWGLLAGWLCPSVVLMLVMLPYIAINKMDMEAHHHRYNPAGAMWYKQREIKV